MGGEGDTYFRQLAVLQTAQQKKNNTKEREAEIREGSQQLYFTPQSERQKERKRQTRKSQSMRKNEGRW